MDFISPELIELDLVSFMGVALEEAKLAAQAGELPIGAVVVIDNQIVSRGHAQQRNRQSQLFHAELNALLEGGERLYRDYRHAILFTTVEPCPMCLGAAVMADIPHIVFALHDKVVYSNLTVTTNPYVKRHIRSYYGGVLEEESVALWQHYDPRVLRYMQTGEL